MSNVQPGEAGAIAHQRAVAYISRFETTGEGSFETVESLDEIIERYGARVKKGDDPALSCGLLAQEVERTAATPYLPFGAPLKAHHSKHTVKGGLFLVAPPSAQSAPSPQ